MRRRVRRGIGEYRQDKGLGVPEGVSVIPWVGQALRRDRSPLSPRPGLQNVEQRETHRLLQFRVSVELDVRVGPEIVQVGSLFGQHPVPAGLQRRGQRGPGLGADSGQ